MSKKIEYSVDYEKLRDDLNFKMNTIRHSASYDVPEYLFAGQMKVAPSTLSIVLKSIHKDDIDIKIFFKFCTWLGKHPSEYIKSNGK